MTQLQVSLLKEIKRQLEDGTVQSFAVLSLFLSFNPFRMRPFTTGLDLWILSSAFLQPQTLK